MAARSGNRNNIIAGLFVIASAAAAVIISVVVSGALKRLTPTRPYVVRFTIAEGAAGLREGAAVTLGGLEVGRVTGVDFVRAPAPPQGTREPTAIDVRVVIRADIVLYEDAWAFLERPLLGNLSVLNIASAGSGQMVSHQGASTLLEPGETLYGTLAPPAFLAQAGYGPDQARQVRQMISEASEAVGAVNRVATRVESQIDPTLTQARGIVDDLRVASAEIREKAPGWSERVERVMAEAEASVAKIRGMIDENRPGVDRIVANVEEATDRVNRQSIDLLNRTLADAGSGAAEFAEAASRVRGLIAQEVPGIERTLANMRLASDQIKLTGVEVRRNPWRLLYQPKTRELESELFYDAARTYAQAVSDLRAASESLEAVAAAGPMLPGVRRETAAELQARLTEAFERYRSAEQDMLRQMSGRTR